MKTPVKVWTDQTLQSLDSEIAYISGSYETLCRNAIPTNGNVDTHHVDHYYRESNRLIAEYQERYAQALAEDDVSIYVAFHHLEYSKSDRRRTLRLFTLAWQQIDNPDDRIIYLCSHAYPTAILIHAGGDRLWPQAAGHTTDGFIRGDMRHGDYLVMIGEVTTPQECLQKFTEHWRD